MFSLLQVKTTAFVFYKKIMAGHLYRPEQKIKGSVCLIKCTNSMTKHADDYGLIEVSGGENLWLKRHEFAN